MRGSQGEKIDATANAVPAANLYLKRGYKLEREELVNAVEAIAQGQMQMLNWPDYYKVDGHYSPDKLFSQLCDAFGCKENVVRERIKRLPPLPHSHGVPVKQKFGRE